MSYLARVEGLGKYKYSMLKNKLLSFDVYKVFQKFDNFVNQMIYPILCQKISNVNSLSRINSQFYVFLFQGMEFLYPKKKFLTEYFELLLHRLSTFYIIWTIIDQVIRVQIDKNISKILYISNDIKFFQTPCIFFSLQKQECGKKKLRTSKETLTNIPHYQCMQFLWQTAIKAEDSVTIPTNFFLYISFLKLLSYNEQESSTK